MTTTTLRTATEDHLEATTLLGGGVRNRYAIEQIRRAIETLETFGEPSSTSSIGYRAFRSAHGSPRSAALAALSCADVFGFVTRELDRDRNYVWTRTDRPLGELEHAAVESIEKTWRARNEHGGERPTEPGERVAIIQPKVYGTGPSDTETTTHFGTLMPGGTQPGDSRLLVEIDSGAQILYPADHVYRVITRKAW